MFTGPLSVYNRPNDRQFCQKSNAQLDHRSQKVSPYLRVSTSCLASLKLRIIVGQRIVILMAWGFQNEF